MDAYEELFMGTGEEGFLAQNREMIETGLAHKAHLDTAGGPAAELRRRIEQRDGSNRSKFLIGVMRCVVGGTAPTQELCRLASRLRDNQRRKVRRAERRAQKQAANFKKAAI